MSTEMRLIGPRDLAFTSYRELPLQVNQVRAQAVLSGISHGTELNLYRGSSPFTRAREAYELIDQHPEQVIKVAFTY